MREEVSPGKETVVWGVFTVAEGTNKAVKLMKSNIFHMICMQIYIYSTIPQIMMLGTLSLSLIWVLIADVAFHIIAKIHAHIGDGYVLSIIRREVSPASWEGEEDGWGNRRQVLIIKSHQREDALIFLEYLVCFGGAQLEDVVEDEAGELGLFFADSEPVGEHGEEAVHKLEVAQAQRFHCFWLVGEVGENLENRFSDFWCRVDE